MTLLQDVKFAVLDTETTGLKVEQGGKICELAVSVSRNGEKIEEFSTLLNPQMPMHPDVIAIHGITNDMVKSAPLFADIVPQLLGVLDGCVLVAHNADFDLGFLRGEMDHCGLHLPDYPVLDTLKLARKNGCFARNNLGTIATTLGINADGAHRALADVRMTEKVLYCFLRDFINGGVLSLEEVQQLQFKRHPSVVLGNTKIALTEKPLFYSIFL